MLGCKNSAVIFVKYRKVSTRTILSNSIDLSAETALYSRFRGVGKKGKKEEAYVRQVLNCFNSTQDNSLGQLE
jgi:hypothetical protein